MPRDTMSAWANTLARNLSTTIRNQAAGRVATDFVLIQGIAAPLYTTAIHKSLLNLHKLFVITVMDKNSSNLVLVCPKFYLQQVLTDLKSPLVLPPGPPPPIPVAPPPPPPPPPHVIAPLPVPIPVHMVPPQPAPTYYIVVNQHVTTATLWAAELALSPMRIPVVCDARLAHYYATIKFHKLPKLQCRFITASHSPHLIWCFTGMCT